MQATTAAARTGTDEGDHYAGTRRSSSAQDAGVQATSDVEAETKQMKSGIVELELFRQILISIAEEMGIVLRKTAYSANIKERRDYSCAVYDERGDTVAMGDHMPVHLGAMPLSVAHAMAAHRLGPGDLVIVNDPFAGGTH